MVRPKNNMKIRKLGLFLALSLALVGLCAAVAVTVDYSPLDKEYYLTQEQVMFIRPGFNVEITDYMIENDGTVWVEFDIKDDKGLPLDMDGVYTPGEIRVSFVISRIPAGKDQYESYITRLVEAEINDNTAIQPTSDSGGTMEEIEIGSYRYTFRNKLPADYDRSATHSIGFYSDRDLEDYGLETPMDDGVVTFVPDGGEVQQIRDIVPNEACARCHDPLVAHGRRHSIELCVMCHYDGVLNPDTQNSVDMRVMVHKIHAGDFLETPYQIFHRGSLTDFSEVVFPQDLRNCDTCHAEPAVQHEAYLLNPTRASCGSCHDSVVWSSGENHVGGPQISDNLCAFCHFPEGELEFDSSIKGAHTIESKSRQLAGLNIEIQEVSNSGPGEKPIVWFALKNDDDTPIDIMDIDRIRFQLSGPTDDYSFHVTETATSDSVPVGAGEYSYTFETAIPADAEGSFAIGTEGRREVLLNAGTTSEVEYEEQGRNTPVFFFPVTDEEAVPRRMIVSDEKCEACHEDLEAHGENRRNASNYCQMCHYPLANDEEVRPEEEMPPRTIDFKMMIHRIHSGAELENDYTIYGFQGSENNFNEIHYVGDRRNCEKCHVDDSYEEAQGNLKTVTLQEFFSPMPPNTTACLGCHDGQATQAHAYLQIAPFGEACMACHGAGNEAGVARVHAR